MADFSAVRTGLKTRLETISGLRVYDTMPDQPQLPAAIVKPTSWSYRLAIGNVNSARFEIILLALGAANGLQKGQAILDGYLDDTGTSSVKAALEGDNTLGGQVATLVVHGVRDYDVLEWATVEYVGAKVDVEIWT